MTRATEYRNPYKIYVPDFVSNTLHKDIEKNLTNKLAYKAGIASMFGIGIYQGLLGMTIFKKTKEKEKNLNLVQDSGFQNEIFIKITDTLKNLFLIHDRIFPETALEN